MNGEKCSADDGFLADPWQVGEFLEGTDFIRLRRLTPADYSVVGMSKSFSMD
jgi:hypothetical protein